MNGQPSARSKLNEQNNWEKNAKLDQMEATHSNLWDRKWCIIVVDRTMAVLNSIRLIPNNRNCKLATIWALVAMVIPLFYLRLHFNRWMVREAEFISLKVDTKIMDNKMAIDSNITKSSNQILCHHPLLFGQVLFMEPSNLCIITQCHRKVNKCQTSCPLTITCVSKIRIQLVQITTSNNKILAVWTSHTARLLVQVKTISNRMAISPLATASNRWWVLV